MTGLSLPENCPYLEFLWSVFSCIWTEYGDLQGKYPYLDRLGEDTDQKNSKYGHFLRSVCIKHLVITSVEEVRQRLTIVLFLHLEFLNSSKSQCTRVITNLKTQCNNEQSWWPRTFFERFKVSPVINAFCKLD